jgi:DNA-binding NtrC family response regulator/tetratricopeptide (TPR) repeat protein
MARMDLGPRYEVRREVGRGGWGRIFLVRDAYLGKDLALKLIDRAPGGPDALDQARREFALLARIEHPRVAKAHDFGRIEAHPFFTYDFIQGKSLGESIAGKDPATLLRWMGDIADAVSFLHRHQVLHLDIKPSNIIVREGGPDAGPVIIDFGLFRKGIVARGEKHVQGSLPYLAPECFHGGAIGPWTDVYALGVTFYRLIAGTYPRWSPGTADLHAVFDRDWDPHPPPPPLRSRGLPEDLAQVIIKCLSLDVEHRFPSARELADSLLQLQGVRGGGLARVRAAGGPTPTLGREEELAAADAFLDRVASGGSPRALLVTGSAGLGQSHLLREVKIRALTRGIRFYLEAGYHGLATAPGSLLRFLGVREAAAGPRERRAAVRWRRFLARLRQPRRPGTADSPDGERRLRHALEVSAAMQTRKEPAVLAVDGLQFWDEVSIELLIDLVRCLGGPDAPAPGKGGRCTRPPPLGVIAGYREEGPAASLLKELSAHLLGAGADAVSLRPLGVKDALELYRHRTGGGEDPEHDGLAVYQETAGSPARIVALAAREAPGLRGAPSAPRAGGRFSSVHGPPADILRVLLALHRPASTVELALFTRLPVRRTPAMLMILKGAGLAIEDESGYWTPSDGAEKGLAPTGEGAFRRAHRRIAEGLLRSARGGEDPRRIEAVQHLAAARMARRAIVHGLPAARYLQATFQSRAALDLFRRLHALLPARARRTRLDVTLDMAGLHARTGCVDEGIRLLRELRLQGGAARGSERRKVLLRLAVLHSRKGDCKLADSLFREGLGGAAAAGRELSREDSLHFLNEHAALKTFLGAYQEASRLCEEGLRRTRGGRSIRIRELSLNLRATLANIALRRFDFAAALEGLEKALGAAEAIGSLGNQAVILNNLGKVYSQCDRYEEAIASFLEAKRTCLRIDEGPSLVAVHGNLAILRAKTGQPDEAERELADARRLSLAAGPREQFFLDHAAGLTRLFTGRFAESEASFAAAIAAGQALGDRHVVEFDAVYRAESLIFLARYAEAAKVLLQLADLEAPRTRMMALARLAFLAAMTGDDDRARALAAEHDAAEFQAVPFLDAWDALLLGWALAMARQGEEARSRLDLAGAFFREHGLKAFRDLARLARAEGLLIESGEGAAAPSAAALKLLDGVEPRTSRLVSASYFLLRARLGRGGGRATEARQRSGLLAEAGAALVANPLPEWHARIEALRLSLRPAGGDDERLALARREEIAEQLPPRSRPAYLGAAHWRAWTRPLRAERPPAPGAAAAPVCGDAATRTIEPPVPPSRRARDRLISHSTGMKKLVAGIDRLRGSDLPVLIRGETGTGKELVARAVHEESLRRDRPFLVLDCAALPEALIEAELAGARAGAYTDQDVDRDGILARCAGGTVLLDGVEHLTLVAQAKFLRIIAERRVRPLGGAEEVSVDVRFLSATTKDLAHEAAEGRFRQDLLHRLQVVTVEVPPLRERPEDLPELIAALVSEGGEASQPAMSPGARRRLESHAWPGNVRQLANVVARLRVQGGDPWTADDVGRAFGDEGSSTFFARNVLAAERLPILKERLEKDYILYHYKRLGGRTPELCALLGLNRRQLYNRLKRLGISLRVEKAKLQD